MLWARKNGGRVEVSDFPNPNVIYRDGIEFINVPVEYERFIDDSSVIDEVNKTVKPAFDTVISVLLAELANIRWLHEVGGVTLPTGARVTTDRESRSLIGDCFNSFMSGLITSTRFKSESGWIELDMAAITLIASCVANHVNTCFFAEMKVSEIIQGYSNIDELISIDINQLFIQTYDENI